MALGLKFEEGSEMAKYNQFVTPSNQRLLFQFVDDLLDSQNKVANIAFDEQEESVLASIKGIVFNKGWSSIWPSDRTPSLELVSPFLLLSPFPFLLFSPFSSM